MGVRTHVASTDNAKFCVSECLGTPSRRTSLCCLLREPCVLQDRDVTTSSLWEHSSRGSEGRECSWMELGCSTAPQPAGLLWQAAFGSPCNAWSLTALVPHQRQPAGARSPRERPGRAGGSPQPAQLQHQGHCSQKDV